MRSIRSQKVRWRRRRCSRFGDVVARVFFFSALLLIFIALKRSFVAIPISNSSFSCDGISSVYIVYAIWIETNWSSRDSILVRLNWQLRNERKIKKSWKCVRKENAKQNEQKENRETWNWQQRILSYRVLAHTANERNSANAIKFLTSSRCFKRCNHFGLVVARSQLHVYLFVKSRWWNSRRGRICGFGRNERKTKLDAIS